MFRDRKQIQTDVHNNINMCLNNSKTVHFRYSWDCVKAPYNIAVLCFFVKEYTHHVRMQMVYNPLYQAEGQPEANFWKRSGYKFNQNTTYYVYLCEFDLLS